MNKLTLFIITLLFSQNIYTQEGLPSCESLDFVLGYGSNSDYVFLSTFYDGEMWFNYGIDFSWVTYDSNNIMYTDSNSTTVIPVNNFESLYSCVTLSTIDTLTNEFWSCQICDFIFWNGEEWWRQSQGNPMGIDELIFHDDKEIIYYDLLGRPFKNFNSIPYGTVYIIDKQKYLKR